MSVDSFTTTIPCLHSPLPSLATTSCYRHPRPVPLPRCLGAPPSSNHCLR
jgi:hypothetical protein